MLALREHSQAELGRKLRARGFEASEIEAVLARLQAGGLLSDARVVETYVAERLAKGFGPLRIRQELRRRGLADPLIDAHLHRPEADWMAHLARVARKRFGSAPTTDRREQARRARFLQSRGFPSGLIARFLYGSPDTE